MVVTLGVVGVTDVDVEETTAGSNISGEEVEVEVATGAVTKVDVED